MSTKYPYRKTNKLQRLLFAATLLAQHAYAEAEAPLPSPHQQIILIARPLTVFERLQIMAQIPLVHYCVTGMVSVTIMYWPFSWPNGVERIRRYLNIDQTSLKEAGTDYENKQTDE